MHNDLSRLLQFPQNRVQRIDFLRRQVKSFSKQKQHKTYRLTLKMIHLFWFCWCGSYKLLENAHAIKIAPTHMRPMVGVAPNSLHFVTRNKITKFCAVDSCRKELRVERFSMTVAHAIVHRGNELDLVHKSPTPNVRYSWTPLCLGIAVPALIGMLADPLLSLIDTAYVGRLGTTELAALGACTSIFHLAFNAFRATTAATTSLVAKYLSISAENGDTSTASAKQVTSTSLWLGCWMGTIVSILLYCFGTHALASMGVPATSSLYPAAKDYLYARLWAAPAVLFIGVAEGAFRGYGDTTIPLLASLVAASMNLILDPLLMFTFGWGVQGAALATAFAQCGAAVVYGLKLVQRRMLPTQKKRMSSIPYSTAAPSQIEIFRTILGANAAMLLKQGSLLLGWAYATARATRLGPDHVAAHQVGLSVWLVFALILDGAAVAAQVLMSRAYVEADQSKVRSLTWYMLKCALLQGIVSMLVVDGIDILVPQLFTKDIVIQRHLHKIMPCLAWQQILVSLTLVTESLAVGVTQFRTLAIGTALSTMLSVWQISKQTTVEGIWSFGIVSLFVGRLLTAALSCVMAFRKMEKDDGAAVLRTNVAM
jgi:putative MATE family efflux protein